jgi:hypothetical protein
MTELPRTPAELRVVARRATWALAAREMRRVLGLWTQTLLPPVITGLIFLALFGGALGGRLGTVSGVPYARFILPGLLVMTVAGQAFANASTSLFQAKNEGYIDDVLSSPLRPSEVVLAYMAGGLLRGWLSALVLAVVAAPFAGAPGDPVCSPPRSSSPARFSPGSASSPACGPTASTSTRSSPISSSPRWRSSAASSMRPSASDSRGAR